jgi:Arc/MetJ-type ribon-helix-helix transcriptional regulator
MCRMTTQVAVRLADDLVEFVDALVRSGEAASRADVVQAALRREQRRRRAAQDAAIYASDGSDEFADMRRAAASSYPAVD